MTRFSTRTVPAMQSLRDALIAAGCPTQLADGYRKIADTTATPDEVRAAAKHAKVTVYIEPGMSSTPITAAMGLLSCSECGALRGDPCRTPSDRTRMPHSARRAG